MQHRRTTAASMFQNGISRNTKCDIMVGFPKSSHILESSQQHVTTNRKLSMTDMEETGIPSQYDKQEGK